MYWLSVAVFPEKFEVRSMTTLVGGWGETTKLALRTKCHCSAVDRSARVTLQPRLCTLPLLWQVHAAMDRQLRDEEPRHRQRPAAQDDASQLPGPWCGWEGGREEGREVPVFPHFVPGAPSPPAVTPSRVSFLSKMFSIRTSGSSQRYYAFFVGSRTPETFPPPLPRFACSDFCYC